MTFRSSDGTAIIWDIGRINEDDDNGDNFSSEVKIIAKLEHLGGSSDQNNYLVDATTVEWNVRSFK